MHYDTECRILVCGDDSPEKNTILQWLKAERYNTVSADDESGALDVLQSDDADLTLYVAKDNVDLNFLKSCTARRFSIPLVLITDICADDELGKFVESGVLDFINFPLCKTKLITKLSGAIRMFNTEQRLRELYSESLSLTETASMMQEYILPDWYTVYNNLQFSSVNFPSADVGGDVYDVICVDENRVVAYVADVSCKGPKAGLIAASFSRSMRKTVENLSESLSPSNILNSIKEDMAQIMDGVHISIVISVVNTAEMKVRFFNAGHPPALMCVGNEKDLSVIDSNGSIPLGWMDNVYYEESAEVEMTLEPGNMFMLYTDGIYLCTDKDGKTLGLDGLVDIVKCSGEDVSELTLAARLAEAFKNLDLNIYNDDFTILAVEMPKIGRNKDGSYTQIFQVKPDLTSAGRVAEEMEALIDELSDNVKLQYDVRIVAHEFLTNIIRHGMKGRRLSSIAVELYYMNEKVRLSFWDKGSGWLPDEGGEMRWFDEASLEEMYAAGGRGLKIINSLSSAFIRKRYADLNETVIVLPRNEDQG